MAEEKTLADVVEGIKATTKKKPKVAVHKEDDPATEFGKAGTEVIAEAAERLKDAGQVRRNAHMADMLEEARKKARPARLDVLAAAKAGEMIDVPNKPDGVTAAEYFMARARDREKQLEIDAAKVDSDTYQYAVRCHRCDKHGIYFTKNPVGGLVPPTGWFSMYKKADEGWMNNEVPCQVCLSSGTNVPLRVEIDSKQTKGGAYIRTGGARLRYIIKFPKDEARYLEEGETPVLERYKVTF